MEGWYCGARMNVNGMRLMIVVDSGFEFGELKEQPRAWRTSAAPEEDVEALLPCFPQSVINVGDN